MEAQEFWEPGSGVKIDVSERQASAPLIEHVTAIAGTNAVALGRPARRTSNGTPADPAGSNTRAYQSGIRL